MVYAVPGEVVEPALAVVEVPEGDAEDLVGVFVEDLENAGVLLGLALEDFGRAAVFVGIYFGEGFAFGAVVGPPAGAGNDVDIEFGDDDFHAEFFHFGEGVFEGFVGDGIEFVMALEADGVDGDVLRAHGFDEANHFGKLRGEFVVVIVVDEEGVRIGGVGVFEGFGDEIFAARFAPDGGAEVIRAVVEGFVDDIPHGDFAFVTANDGVDVGFHAAEEEFAGDGFVAVLREPGRSAVVLGPDEGVADDFEVVGDGEVDEGIGHVEGPLTLLALDGVWLHAILGREVAEVLLEERPVMRAFGDAVAEADADREGGEIIEAFGEERRGEAEDN